MMKSISNKHQMTKLVQLMECNPDIAKGNCTKKDARDRWEMFADILNSLGPPVKSPEKWVRVWVDLKSKTKKKLTNNTKKGVFNILSPLDIAVDQLMDFNNSCAPWDDAEWSNSYEDGELKVDEDDSSLLSNDKEEKVVVVNEATASSFDDNTPASPPVKRKKISSNNVQSSRMALLEAHTEEEQIFHKNICQKLGDIASAVDMMRQEQREHHKVIENIEKEKLKLIQENNEKNEKYRAEKLQILRQMYLFT